MKTLLKNLNKIFMFKKLINHVCGTSLLIYSCGFYFGMLVYHKKINDFAFNQAMISDFEKYGVSFDKHLLIGNIYGITFLKGIIYLPTKSFGDSINEAKIPYYLK